MTTPQPAELPRTLPDTRAPINPKIITAGPSGRDYTEAQDAYDAAVHEARASDMAVVLDNDAEYRDVVFRTRTPGVGKVVVMPAQMPKPGRVGPGMRLPKLTSLTTNGIVRCEDGAHKSYLVGLEIAVPDAPHECYVAVDFSAQTLGVLDAQPDQVGVNRCYIHGTPTTRLRRAISLNCRAAFVTDSYIDDVHDLLSKDGGNGNGDTQAIACWEGAGNHLVGNSRLRAAGEIILYGGADPAIRGLVSADVTIDRCWLDKPLAWRARYPCKNDLELKTVRRFWMRRCIVEGNWVSNQTGVGFVIAAMHGDQGEGLTVEDVTLTDLFVRNMSSFLTLSAHGTDNIPQALMTRRVSLRNVLAANINGVEPYAPDNSNRSMVLAGLTDTEIDQVTVLGPTGHLTRALSLDGAPAVRSTIRRAIMTAEGTGIAGGGTAPGAGAIAVFMPEPNAVTDCAFVGVDPAFETRPIPGCSYPATLAEVGVNDPTIVDRWDTAPHEEVLHALTLKPDSPQRGRGFDAPTLAAAIANVVTGSVAYPTDTSPTAPAPPSPSTPPTMNLVERLKALADKFLGINASLTTALHDRDQAIADRDVAATARDKAIEDAKALQAQLDALAAEIARLETGS